MELTVEKEDYDQKLQKLKTAHELLLSKLNQKKDSYNGIYDRYKNPVLTADHVPLYWRFDFDRAANSNLMERLGVGAVCNAGAMKWKGKYLLVGRVEGYDRKSIFGIAESPNGIDNFRFWDYPINLPETEDPDTNTYDMRLIDHEDGWIYGVFCTERKDPEALKSDTSAAMAQAGIARTKDLVHWERLPDLKSKSKQQRNVVLHPEFVDGKYAFYTRPQDGFIDTGAGGGIAWALCDDIENPVVENEKIMDHRIYHTIKEVKNGQGPAPIKTEDGWLHLAHGVRNTASGLRYILYLFMTDLKDPSKIIHQPGSLFLGPEEEEYFGHVSNVAFSNGWIKDDDGKVFIYYATADTRMHVATSHIELLVDYVKNTPADPLRSAACTTQRSNFITNNLKIMKASGNGI